MSPVSRRRRGRAAVNSAEVVVVTCIRSQPLRALVRECALDAGVEVCIAPGERRSVRVFRDWLSVGQASEDWGRG